MKGYISRFGSTIIKIDLFIHNTMHQLQMPITVVTEAKKKKKLLETNVQFFFEKYYFSAMNTFFTSILIQKTILQVQSVSQE